MAKPRNPRSILTRPTTRTPTAPTQGRLEASDARFNSISNVEASRHKHRGRGTDHPRPADLSASVPTFWPAVIIRRPFDNLRARLSRGVGHSSARQREGGGPPADAHAATHSDYTHHFHTQLGPLRRLRNVTTMLSQLIRDSSTNRVSVCGIKDRSQRKCGRYLRLRLCPLVNDLQ